MYKLGVQTEGPEFQMGSDPATASTWLAAWQDSEGSRRSWKGTTTVHLVHLTYHVRAGYLATYTHTHTHQGRIQGPGNDN